MLRKLSVNTEKAYPPSVGYHGSFPRASRSCVRGANAGGNALRASGLCATGSLDEGDEAVERIGVLKLGNGDGRSAGVAGGKRGAFARHGFFPSTLTRRLRGTLSRSRGRGGEIFRVWHPGRRFASPWARFFRPCRADAGGAGEAVVAGVALGGRGAFARFEFFPSTLTRRLRAALSRSRGRGGALSGLAPRAALRFALG